MTRITPITDRDQLPPDRQHEWDFILENNGGVRGPFGVMLTSPGIAPAFLALIQQARGTGVVSAALHELAILAVAYEYQAPYQWSAHIARARESGLSGAAIEVARNGGDHAGLDAGERDVVAITRQLCRTHHVDQPTFDALTATYGPDWLTYVIATIGLYQCVATFNNAYDVAPRPGDDRLPVG